MTTERIETLFRAHWMPMYRLARTILYDEEESKDVVQDVFARLLDEDVVLRPETAGHYLLASVRNRCRNILEHRTVRERFARLCSERATLPTTDPGDDARRLDELMAYIEANLSPTARQVFRMRFLQDMTYRDIADALGVSRVTVYKHLSQAVASVRAYFKSNQ